MKALLAIHYQIRKIGLAAMYIVNLICSATTFILNKVEWVIEKIVQAIAATIVGIIYTIVGAASLVYVFAPAIAFIVIFIYLGPVVALSILLFILVIK